MKGNFFYKKNSIFPPEHTIIFQNFFKFHPIFPYVGLKHGLKILNSKNVIFFNKLNKKIKKEIFNFSRATFSTILCVGNLIFTINDFYKKSLMSFYIFDKKFKKLSSNLDLFKYLCKLKCIFPSFTSNIEWFLKILMFQSNFRFLDYSKWIYDPSKYNLNFKNFLIMNPSKKPFENIYNFNSNQNYKYLDFKRKKISFESRDLK